MSAALKSARRSWRPRFSLRTLFILLTLSCAVTWLGYRCERQRAAIAQLHGRQATWVIFKKPPMEYPAFIHDYVATVEEVHLGSEDIQLERLTAFPRLSRLTVWGLGEGDSRSVDFSQFRQLRELRLCLSAPPASTLASLARLPCLESLALHSCEFEPGWMKVLRSANMKSLSLSGTKIQVADLADLPTGLKSLDLSNTPIVDADLAGLPPLAGLRRLNLLGTSVSNAGLKHLRRFELHALDVSRTEISDLGLLEIGRMEHLQELNLGSTGITNEGLANLSRLNRLQELHLQNTSLGDPALAQIGEFKNLRVLSLAWTKVTDAGLPSLAVLQNCESILLPTDGVTEKGEAWLCRRLGRRPREVHRFYGYICGNSAE